MDPYLTLNTLMPSTRHWAQFFAARPRSGFTPPAIVPNITRWDSRSLLGRPLYGSRKEEASFADTRLNALTLCLLESVGVRHAVVGALSALKANYP